METDWTWYMESFLFSLFKFVVFRLLPLVNICVCLVYNLQSLQLLLVLIVPECILWDVNLLRFRFPNIQHYAGY